MDFSLGSVTPANFANLRIKYWWDGMGIEIRSINSFPVFGDFECSNVSKENKELTIRRITCRNKKDGSTFVVMTDERNWAANKIVTMYVYRWPIEVLFRHIKTNLNVIHFPSHDPQGVRNWMLFVMLSLIFVLTVTLDGRSDYRISLMARNSQFKPLLRLTQILIDSWMIIEIERKLG